MSATDQQTEPADLAVIVFAYNEAENVGPVLTELCSWLDQHEPDHEIVFIDDGSSDQTTAEAYKVLGGRRARLLRHARNRGIGAALKTAVRATSAHWVTFVPADGQIEPAAIGILRAAAHSKVGSVDTQATAHGATGPTRTEGVTGQAVDSRPVEVVFSVYDDRNDGLDRKLLSLGVRALIAAVHQVVVRSDGPYLFRRSLFDPDQLKPDTFFLNFEFPIRVAGANLPRRTVTIRCRPRRAGVSKSTGLRRIWGVGRDLFELRLRRARERSGHLVT
jgi:dolichol-phosphate mannosyltransferase